MRGVPWRRILRSRNLWALCLMYFCQSYGWYFYITYLPDYLEQHYGVTAPILAGGASTKEGRCGWAPSAAWWAGSSPTGSFAARAIAVGAAACSACVGHALTAVCFLLCPLCPNAFWFFVAISLAGFFTDLTMGADWATCQDIGRRYAAIVAGFMNMVGNFGGGAVASWMSGFVLQKSLDGHAARLGAAVTSLSATEKTVALLHGYHINFLVAAAVYVVGVLCWFRIDPTKPVVAENDVQPAL